jgi:ribokinase
VICTLGDLLLDVIVRLEGPIAEDTDTYGRTRVGAGGQAANVAAWVVALGGRARFVGKRAEDPAGRLLAEELEGRGVELAGTVVSIATPNGARTMLSDRGVSTAFSPEELDTAWLDGCEWLHIPGYSLVRSPLRETALAAASNADRVSVDLSSTAAIEEFGVDAFRETLAEMKPEVVFANEAESDLVGNLHTRTEVVKLGAKGAFVREWSSGPGPTSGPTYAATYPATATGEVLDTTGAGDAFAAGFLLSGPELAVEAAARCVAKMGAMP